MLRTNASWVGQDGGVILKNKPLRQIGAVVVVGLALILLAINSRLPAQQPPQPRNEDQFVTAGGYHINVDQIGYVKQEQPADHQLRVAIHFKGANESALVLEGEEAAGVPRCRLWQGGDRSGRQTRRQARGRGGRRHVRVSGPRCVRRQARAELEAGAARPVSCFADEDARRAHDHDPAREHPRRRNQGRVRWRHPGQEPLSDRQPPGPPAAISWRRPA